MINLDELKPILEGLELTAEAIEGIVALDKPVEAPDFSAEREALNNEWSERFRKTFFGEKPEDIVEEVAPVIEEVEAEPEITISDLFTEEKEEVKEDD